MKKILFSGRYGLTEAVLQGRKTMTRRFVGKRMTEDDIKAYLKGYTELADKAAQYKIGEVVAVAQSYKDLGYTKEWVEQHINPSPNAKPTDPFEKKYPGWNNMMFVPSELNKAHQIRITDIKVERLQDISEEDCLKEGLIKKPDGFIPEEYFYTYCGANVDFAYVKTAFADLIDKVSGKGTWERNPWVFAYSFELIK